MATPEEEATARDWAMRCQQVATMRRAGLPDTMIAADLGVSVDRLRSLCPDDPSNPLGLHGRPEPSHPAAPRGHDSAPLDLTPPLALPIPYTSAPASDDAGALFLFLLFAPRRKRKRKHRR